MPALTEQHASERNSDVTVIDIDADIDTILANTDKVVEDSDIPVIHIDKPKEVKAMNGNGKL